MHAGRNSGSGVGGFCAVAVKFFERFAEISPHQFKRSLDGMPCSGNEHIVIAGHTARRDYVSGKCSEPALGAIARNRVPDFLGSGEPDPNWPVGIVMAKPTLENKAFRDGFGRFGGGNKITPLAQRFHAKIVLSGAQFVASATTARIQNLATVLGGHARAESVAVLAYAVGRLKSAFHETAPFRAKFDISSAAAILPYAVESSCD